MRAPALAALALLLAGCMSASDRLNRLSLGISKSQAIDEIGSPSYSAANGDVEFLVYRLIDPKWDRIDEYFVKLVDGRVVAFGRIGDFDTAKVPTNFDAYHRIAEADLPEPTYAPR